MRRLLQRARRAWVAWAALTLIALSIEEGCALWLAARDPFALASQGHWITPALIALLLAGSRAFVLLATPGWALWLAVRTFLAFGRER
jgi:hypothetical protein